MIKQTIFAAIIFSYGAYAMEKNENKMEIAEILSIAYKYELGKDLLEQKVKKAVDLYNQVYKKNIKWVTFKNPKECHLYNPFPDDLQLTQGILLSKNFGYIKVSTSQTPYYIGHLDVISDFHANHFLHLRDLIFVDMKVKPYIIKMRDGGDGEPYTNELHFFSILKIDTLEFPAAESNYPEIDLAKN